MFDDLQPRRSSETAEESSEADAVVDKLVEVVYADAGLLHGVAFAECDGVVLEGLVVDGDAVGCAYGILAAVALADGVFLIVACGEVKLEVVDYLAGLVGETVLLDEREHGALHRSESRRQVEHHAFVATFEGLLLIR